MLVNLLSTFILRSPFLQNYPQIESLYWTVKCASNMQIGGSNVPQMQWVLKVCLESLILKCCIN